MPVEFLTQLNQLSDVELPTLGLIAVIGFVVVLLVIGLMFRSIARGQEKRETTLTSVFTSALNTLAEQVDLNRQAYLDAREEFRGLRESSTTSDAAIVATVTSQAEAVKQNSQTQADRAIGAVEKRIETAESNFQTGMNLINQQLLSVNRLLEALDTKVTTATATQSETKSTIELVRGMVNDALALLNARKEATGEHDFNSGEARLPELISSLPAPGDIKRDPALTVVKPHDPPTA